MDEYQAFVWLLIHEWNNFLHNLENTLLVEPKLKYTSAIRKLSIKS